MQLKTIHRKGIERLHNRCVYSLQKNHPFQPFVVVVVLLYFFCFLSACVVSISRPLIRACDQMAIHL